jgi:choline dehydrogenase
VRRYPRAGTLGGCVSHNALIWILPHASDWDNIAEITGDNSWSSSNMAQYIDSLSEWLPTKPTDPTLLAEDTQFIQHVVAGAAVMGEGPSPLKTVIGLASLLHDPNAQSPSRDSTQGYFQIPLTQENGARRAVRDFIVDTVNAGYPLTVRTNCHVTKVVFDTSSGTPRATGVEFLDGAHLYRASPLSGTTGTAGSANATKEVILAGGTYNSVQMLKLSGIGPKAELASFGINTLVDLPGVGTNMQDRYEIPVNVVHETDFSLLDGCTFDGKAHDECFEQWVDTPVEFLASRGTYGSNGFATAMGVRSDFAANSDLDLFIFGGPVDFTGYFPYWGNAALADHKHFSWYALKAHTRNTAGTVHLRSADPLDPPVINFNYFDTGTTANGADADDLGALVQAVRKSRQALAQYSNYNILGGSSFVEQNPGANVTSDEDIGQYVKDRAWGHHASCTNPIGADGDPNAVLDSEFRVRGTLGLRVVDASVFPRIPGIFIQAPVIMVSEKAADVILNGGSTGS